jgi:peptidoglycan/xylan/chitin deacetylase (PgdA/CDA1 family)
VLKRLAKHVLQYPVARAAALAIAGLRAQSLVLVYHRIRADGAVVPAETTPSLERQCLRAQLEALAELGDIVDLPRVLEWPTARRRPRFAITFDDDYVHHVAHALPVLRELGVPATFFLSGRALHGLGPYWWEQLEALVAAEGLVEAGRALGVSGMTVQALALVCETNLATRRHLAEMAPATSDGSLDPAGIRALTDAGMTIGFHTLRHPLLPSLEDDPLRAALRDGHAELAAAVGQPVTLFAYPHGKADARVAAAARTAGYRAAWTGWPRPCRVGDDPFQLGRWEPGPLPVDAFVTSVAVRLHRASPH